MGRIVNSSYIYLYIHIYIIIIIIIIICLKCSVLTQPLRMIQKEQNTRDHLAWPTGNGDPTHEVCIQNSILRAWEQQEWKNKKT